VVEIGWQFLPVNAIHLLPHGIRILRDIEFIPGKPMVFADSLQQSQAYLMPHMRRRLVVRIHLRLTIPALYPITACKRLENHAFNLPNMGRTIADIIRPWTKSRRIRILQLNDSCVATRRTNKTLLVRECLPRAVSSSRSLTPECSQRSLRLTGKNGHQCPGARVHEGPSLLPILQRGNGNMDGVREPPL